MNEYCQIVQRDELRLLGIRARLCAESGGRYAECGGNAVRALARKWAQDGTLQLLRALCKGAQHEIIGARVNITGDGVYDLIFGVTIDRGEDLPEHLPEYAQVLTIPAGAYARMTIDEKGAGKSGFAEQMKADAYFIGQFRKDTPYVYDKAGVPYNTFDEQGEFLDKYEPIKIPADELERMDSFAFAPVVLPDILCACSTSRPDEEFVIWKYFAVQDQVLSLDIARPYAGDYYGFPTNPVSEPLVSAFGSRVTSFEGLPDCVERLTVQGGLYLHIWQLECNGDNPSMCYDVAFHHLDRLYLNAHSQYERDHTKHVIARFRQANFASVFVPLRLRGA